MNASDDWRSLLCSIEFNTNIAGHSAATKLSSHYLEDMTFNSEATQKKSKHPDRDKATTTKLVTKTATFVRSSTFNFWLARGRKSIE